MYFIVHLYVLTTHVTVCVCHTEIKGYLLTYLYTSCHQYTASFTQHVGQRRDTYCEGGRRGAELEKRAIAIDGLSGQ